MKVIKGNRLALEQQAIKRLAKGEPLTDLEERLRPKGCLKSLASGKGGNLLLLNDPEHSPQSRHREVLQCLS